MIVMQVGQKDHINVGLWNVLNTQGIQCVMAAVDLDMTVYQRAGASAGIFV